MVLLKVLPTNEEGSYILPEESPDCELRSINIASSSDILFVIETTESASPFIPEIRNRLKEFARVKTTIQGPKVLIFYCVIVFKNNFG